MAGALPTGGPAPCGELANKLKRMVVVLVYFAVGSLFYSITEGWAPLDSCYFLIVCAFGTPFTPGTLVCLSLRVCPRARRALGSAGPAPRSGSATSALKVPLASSSRVRTRWWA